MANSNVGVVFNGRGLPEERAPGSAAPALGEVGAISVHPAAATEHSARHPNATAEGCRRSGHSLSECHILGPATTSRAGERRLPTPFRGYRRANQRDSNRLRWPAGT